MAAKDQAYNSGRGHKENSNLPNLLSHCTALPFLTKQDEQAGAIVSTVGHFFFV